MHTSATESEVADRTPKRSYRSPRRAEGAATTGAAIAAALAEQLGRSPHGELSVPEAAATAGVGVRTVYHHLPTHDARLRAVAGWVDDALGPLPPIAGAADLADHARRAQRRGARRLDLVRALARASRVDDQRTRRRRSHQLDIAALLAGIGAPTAPTNRATAIVAALSSPEALLPLVEAHGLDPDDAVEAVAEAVEAVVWRLRSRRSEAPGSP
jgi:AcrR family transcriptional regulator